MTEAEPQYRVVKTVQGAMQFRVDWKDDNGIWQRVDVCADAERQADLVIEQHRQARSRGAAKDEVVRYVSGNR